MICIGSAAITMMKSDPMTAFKYIERELGAINTAGKKKFGEAKWTNFKLTDEEVNYVIDKLNAFK